MNAMPTTAARTLGEMRREIVSDSSLYRKCLRAGDEIDGGPGFSDLLTAAGKVSSVDDSAYRLGLEYIFEGYLLHYGTSRLLEPDSNEFSLLAGDHMYARGLARIATLDDLYCIGALADLLRFCAFVHCEGLDPSLALHGWAMITLLLAGRAASGGQSTVGRPAGGVESPVAGASVGTATDTGYTFSGLCEIVWADGDDDNGHTKALEVMIAEQLVTMETAASELRELIDAIYANFLRRPDGA